MTAPTAGPGPAAGAQAPAGAGHPVDPAPAEPVALPAGWKRIELTGGPCLRHDDVERTATGWPVLPSVYVDEFVEIGEDRWTPNQAERFARVLLEAASQCRAWRDGAR